MRIARDLESFKTLKQIDSVKDNTISQLTKENIQKDTVNSLLTQKIDYLQQINIDLVKTTALQADISKQYKKQVTVLKLERAGIVTVAVALLIKVFIK